MDLFLLAHHLWYTFKILDLLEMHPYFVPTPPVGVDRPGCRELQLRRPDPGCHLVGPGGSDSCQAWEGRG